MTSLIASRYSSTWFLPKIVSSTHSTDTFFTLANGVIGLAVPAMPMGSPGMEYQNKFDPYDVLLLMKDGSSKVYAQITSLEESVK